MKQVDRNEYIKYRLWKSEKTYHAAKILVENGEWDSAVNRFYYAAYYAVSGLLFQSRIEAKTHSGIKNHFFMNFIKSGKLAMEFGQTYSKLFDWRQKGDYSDFVEYTEEDDLSLMEPTKVLIEAVRREIDKPENQ